MGCCNHEPLGRPISRWRYYAGVAALTGAHAAGRAALWAVSRPAPRYRKVARFYGEFAHIPVFEPATQQEAYDFTREAFDYSEEIGLPVMVRIVTRLAHSRANVRYEETEAVAPDGEALRPPARHRPCDRPAGRSGSRAA